MDLKTKLDEIIFDFITNLEASTDNQFSLLNGNAGIFLFAFLYAKEYNLDLPEYDVENIFTKSLNKTFENPQMNFSDGVSGIGLMLQFMVDEELMNYGDVKEVLEQIDEFAYQFAMSCLRNKNHDFLYGAIGEMVYLLSRIENNSHVKTPLIEIGNSLIEIGQESAEDIYWYESKFMLEGNQKNSEVINLGISHGQASKVVIFSKLIENGIEVERYRKILSKAVNFLLGCKLKFTENTLFPGIIESNKGSDSAFWWSYGDLGIGIALFQAGNALGNYAVIKEGVDIYLKYQTTKIEETGIFEPSLCRGTSGVALMYHNMFLNTGNRSFQETSDYWFDETLKFAKYDHDSIGGYKYLNNYSLNRDEWFYQSNPNLLMGTAGVGLALLSKLSGKKLTWSRCLLLN